MAVTAWKYPGTVASGGTGWNFSNPDNLKADDGSFTNAGDASVSGPEAYLTAFTFGVPSGATIDGIEAEIQHRDSFADGSYNSFCFLSWNGGTNETAQQNWLTASNPGSTFVNALIGGATSLFGRTWTDTELNNTNFRLRWQTSTDAYPTEYEVDYIRGRIYYTVSGGANAPTGNINGPLVGPLGGVI